MQNLLKIRKKIMFSVYLAEKINQPKYKKYKKNQKFQIQTKLKAIYSSKKQKKKKKKSEKYFS